MNRETESQARAALRRLIGGHRMTQALGIAAQLAITDLLADGPRASDELARLRGCNPDALYRVLRLLASEGVFAEQEGRRFALTPRAALLQTGTENSLRAQALIEAREWSAAWSELAFSVATGEPAFPRVFGAAASEYYTQRAPARALAEEALAAAAGEAGAAVAAAYDCSSMRLLAELDAGKASLLPALLAANPGLLGIVFAAGEAPPGAGGYVLQTTQGGWDDERLLGILRDIRAAMGGDARLLAVEPLVVTGDESSVGGWEDVNRLVLAGGGVRTRPQYQALFEAAGLRLTRMLQAGAARAILEAQ